MKSNEQMIQEVTAQVVQKKKAQKKRRIRIAAFGITMLLLLTAMIPAVSASRRYGILDLLRDPASHTEQLSPPEEVEALRAQIEAAADPFAHLDPNMPVLLDYSSAVPSGDTFNNNGYSFVLREILNGKAIVNQIVRGSMTDGEITRQETIMEKTFLIVDVFRQDYGKLTEEEKTMWFHAHRLVAGYNPKMIDLSLWTEHLYELNYADEECIHFLVDISSMLIFADHTLAVAITDPLTHLESDIFYANKDGEFAFREEALNQPHALFYIDLPESYADQKAVREFIKQHGISDNMSGFNKN